MTDLNRMQSDNVDAVTAVTGTIVTANRTSGSPLTWGVTLASATTYFFPFGAFRAPIPAEGPYAASHFRWDANIIVTLTLETSNFSKPMNPGDPRGPDAISDFETTAGFWMQENPTSGVYVSGSGSGGLTATNLTLVVAGGTAGGSTIQLGNLGMRRARWKAVVGGTGGVIRCGIWGKGF